MQRPTLRFMAAQSTSAKRDRDDLIRTNSTLKMASFDSRASMSLRLPCGLMLKNRLVKSAMSENMAVNFQPSPSHSKLYAKWAAGGWAMLITGKAERGRPAPPSGQSILALCYRG